MPLSLRTLAPAFLLASFLPSSALAQLFPQTKGTPRFGTFGGGPDVINLANLNNHLTIPVFHKPGRGLNFESTLTYDSSLWLTPSSSGSSLWQPATNWGWGAGGTDIGTISYTVSGPTNCLSGGRVVGTKTFWSNWVYYDSSGTPHPFYGSVEGDTSGCPSGGGTDSLSELALDGSGYTLNLTGDCCRPKIDKIQVVSPDGALITPGSNIQDTNGNTISLSNGQLMDTLGSVPVTISGASPNPVTYTYTTPSGSSAIVTVTYRTYTVQTNFGCSGIPEYGPTSNSLVDRITMPNGTFYQFSYELTPGSGTNVTGRLGSITLPTGGSISYAYSGGNHGIECADGTTAGFTRTTPDGTWTYSRTLGSGGQSTTTITDPLGNQTVMQFLGIYQTVEQVYQGSSSTGSLLETVSTCYDGLTSNCTTTSFGTPISQLAQTIQLGSTGPIRKHVNFYDGGPGTLNTGVLTEQDDYDYASGGPGPLLKKALYGNGCTSSNGRILSVIVQNGSGTQISKVTYNYDETTPVATSGLPQHGAVTLPRCNLTSQSQWLNTTGGQITSHMTYFDTGMLNTATDPNGHTTTYSYSSSFAGAYVTTATNALNQSTTYNYDVNSGVTTSVTDANNQQTTFAYDSMLRPTTTNFPDGGQTTVSYNDTALPASSTTTTKMNSSQNIVSTVLLDGLGRTTQTQLTSDLAGTDYTDTTYDATVSNPHRSTASPTDGTTTFLYDALGRTTQVTRPDGATVLITYIGPATEFQDESRVTRISQSDGLGRLTSVCEVSNATLIGTSGTPAACGQDIAATGFLTTYQYDALDNLTQVNQGGLNTRTFSYDSLSRLTSATNPESGTICYGTYSANVCQRNGYDANGNLTTKTDARSITTTYSYDALNRLTQKTYSDTTPKAVFNYDETAPWGWMLSNPIGRLTTTYTKNSSGGTIVSSLNSYDPMGRVAVYEQCQPLSCGPAPSLALAYTYNLLGEPISMHPSQTSVFNFTLSYSYNSTAHLATITSSLNDANHPQTLFSGASYNAPALLTTATLGGIVNEHRSYNWRLWPTSTTVDSSVYSYSMTSYAPNGNVLGVNDSVNGNWVYKYDDFNRLTCSNLSSNGTCAAPTNGTPTYTYDYDRFGNRWHQNGPQSMQLSFSGNNNRMDGYSYDAAGNLSNDGNYAYTYDAENRIIQVNLPGPGGALVATYTYDASGNRVSKASGGVSLAYFYDTEGHVVVETNLNTSPATWTRGEIFAAGRHIATYSGGTSGTTNFIETDWLGTERVRTNHSGAVCETINSLPFGDGQSTSTSCGDLSPLHFTGKERDSESGLDNSKARYLGSSLGRFMSPDPSNLSVDFWLPQTWNRYAYALNNPLAIVDRNGQWPTYIHNEIINEAFPGLSNAELQTLRQASYDTDYTNRVNGHDPQDPEASFVHGMSDGLHNQDPMEAQREGDAFIAQNEHDAQQIQADWEAAGNTGIAPAALTAFGNALHTIEDRLSPAHAGNQPWYGTRGARNKVRALRHVYRESTINQAQRNAALAAARAAFLKTFGLQLQLLAIQHQRACTTIQGPNGPETHCED